MAIMAKSGGKHLSTHLMDASNNLTLEIVKDITSSKMELVNTIRTAMMEEFEKFGDEYKKQMQDAGIRREGELAGLPFLNEVDTILKVSGINGKFIGFTFNYNYRDESYSVEKQEPQLRLGKLEYKVLNGGGNPLERLLNQYILGEIDNLDSFYKRLLTQFKNKASNAYKNCTMQGTANYVYNQYIKGIYNNPFTKKQITLDLFTNSELIKMSYGTISGTRTAVEQLSNTFNSFLRNLKLDSLESYGVTQSLFDDLRSEFESGRGLSSFKDVLFSMLVEEFNENGTISLTNFKPYWGNDFVGSVLHCSRGLSVRLNDGALDSFLDYIWNNLMTDEMKASVLSSKANVMVMDRSNLIFGLGSLSSSSNYFESYVSTDDIRNAIVDSNFLIDIKEGKVSMQHNVSGHDYVFNRSRLKIGSSLGHVNYVEQLSKERIGIEPEVVIATSLEPYKGCKIGASTLVNLAKKLSTEIDKMDRQSTVLDTDGEFTTMLDKYLTASDYLEVHEIENLQWLRGTVQCLDTSDYNVYSAYSAWNYYSNSCPLVLGNYKPDSTFIVLRK